MRAPSWILFTTLLTFSVACGSDAVAPEGSSEVTSQSGNLRGVFSPDPDPPVVGKNRVTLSLTDVNGADIEGATIHVEPWMPAHGHGSHVTPQVTDLGGGDYTVDVTLHMPGFWELRTVVAGGVADDQLVVGFDVH